jgi:hypothetical protein
MRPPRFSISGLMALTVLIALDCLVVRAVLIDNTSEARLLFFFGGVPWLNILAIGLFLLRRRWRRREPLAFLVGFEAVGWAVFAIHLALIGASPSEYIHALTKLTAPLDPLAGVFFPAGLVVACAIVMSILTLPQWVVAFVGGMLARRYRIRIERRVDAGVAR